MTDTRHREGGPRSSSPAAVANDPAYEEVADRMSSSYPGSIEHVVRHKPTDTLWRCHYTIRPDDSDYGCGANWNQVKAVEVKQVVYEAVE